VIAISPFFVELEMIDGSTAPPALGVLTGFLVGIPGILMLVASGLVWFVVRPEQRASRVLEAKIDRLCELGLQLYSHWLMQASRTGPLNTIADTGSWRHEAELWARQLFSELDPPRRRRLLQLLYDLELLQGDQTLDLRGVDLGAADLSGIDLRNAVLTGMNLRRANLSRARLDAADLRATQVTTEQLALTASTSSARLS
jgi:hypothetical protein